MARTFDTSKGMTKFTVEHSNPESKFLSQWMTWSKMSHYTDHQSKHLPSLCEKTLVVFARSQSSAPTLCKPARSRLFINENLTKKPKEKKSPSSPLICVWGSRWRHCWIHWQWWAGGTGGSPSVQSRLDQIDNAIIHRVPLWYLDLKAISCLAAAIT